MNEAAWSACDDHREMLDSLRSCGRATDRKFRLFACSCARRVWHLLVDEWSRAAVEVAERFADGLASDEDLRIAYVGAYDAAFDEHENPFTWRLRPEQAAMNAAMPTCGTGDDYFANDAAWAIAGGDTTDSQAERVHLCQVLRCLFGDLPRAVSLDSAWLLWQDGLVVRLAQAVYKERHLPEGTLDWDRLAVLADALEEAGVTDALLLEHLRGPGPHVRGCFAIDAILTLGQQRRTLIG